ncbi:hypothetical protein LZS92_27525, partial [Vibrio campbellii]|nr:hypothetical protein [Vibrio campbellii]
MNKMPLTIFNSNFGTMEDENGGSPMQWANCQTIGDFQENGDKVGALLRNSDEKPNLLKLSD